MTDGDHVVPMATSQDHKRVGDGDTGLNTGGMGAYSPAPVVTREVYQRVMDEIIFPTIKGMKAEGCKYVGFLYAGLMIDSTGAPKVIEFNCRFGDPETQPVMMRMKSDLADLCLRAVNGELSGLDTPSAPDTKIFQAGTRISDGQVVTSGGRVLCATALGNTVSEAQEKAYALARTVSWDGMFFRHDIAYRAIRREKQ